MVLNQDEVITIDEAKARYPKQWLGVEVVERDEESGQPITVKVLAKNMDLFQIFQIASRVIKHMIHVEKIIIVTGIRLHNLTVYR